MRHALILSFVAALLVGGAAPARADTSPAGAALLVTLDTNRDRKLDQGELEQGLATALTSIAELRGVADGLPRRAFITRTVSQALNMIRADWVDADTIDSFLAFRLGPPLAVTLRDLLLPNETPKRSAKTGASFWTWIQVRQSALDEQSIGKPAKLSYASRDLNDESQSNNPRSQWNINAALIISAQQDKTLGNLHLTPMAAYEVSVDSAKPQKDRITHRLGVLGSYTTPGSDLLASHYLQVTFDFATERTYAARILGGTAEYSPTIFPLAIGRFTDPEQPVKFRWRPYVGLEVGHVANAGPLTALDPNFTNLFFRVTPELVIVDRVKLSPTLSWWRQLIGGQGGFAYYEWSGRVVLSESEGKERASIDVSYNRGRQSPTFRQTGVLKISLAVKL